MEKVGDELRGVDDDLSEWAKARGPSFFVPVDAAGFPALKAVSDWPRQQDYGATAINTFLQSGDYYLVSQALAGHHTVVTHEVPTASPKKIKIPNACIGLQIKCITPFDMLRSERARFVLGDTGTGIQTMTPGNLFQSSLGHR